MTRARSIVIALAALYAAPAAAAAPAADCKISSTALALDGYVHSVTVNGIGPRSQEFYIKIVGKPETIQLIFGDDLAPYETNRTLYGAFVTVATIAYAQQLRVKGNYYCDAGPDGAGRYFLHQIVLEGPAKPLSLRR